MRTMPLLAGLLALASCTPRDSEPAAPGEPQAEEAAAHPGSQQLAAHFPLLPMIEKKRWSQLLAAEAALGKASDPAEREAAETELERLIEALRSRHPFKINGQRMELGGIIYDRLQGHISLPAKVEYPNPGDQRHPGEVELLLCTEAGRLHETLFVTGVRPLHLELLLHLAGHAKGPQGGRFHIVVLTKEGVRIPVESMIRASGGELLESPLLWEFSGSDYQDLYAPDFGGDFAIFWHAHDSVLRVVHEGIASGVVKLEAVPHPQLPNGERVVLELIPVTE